MKVSAALLQRALHVALSSVNASEVMVFKSSETASWEGLMEALTSEVPIEIDYSTRYDSTGSLVTKS